MLAQKIKCSNKTDTKNNEKADSGTILPYAITRRKNTLSCSFFSHKPNRELREEKWLNLKELVDPALHLGVQQLHSHQLLQPAPQVTWDVQLQQFKPNGVVDPDPGPVDPYCFSKILRNLKKNFYIRNM